MADQNTALPLEDNTSEQTVTDEQQNTQPVDQQVEQEEQTVEETQNQTQQDDQNVTQEESNDDHLSRSERRQQRYAEKMADRLREQAEQDAQYGRQLFSQPSDYKPLQYQEGDYDVDQLAADRRQYAQQSYNEGVRQGQSFYEAERFADRLEVDIDRVMSKREDIDEVTEQLLVESYLDKVGAREDQSGRMIIENPNLRFRDFADEQLKKIDDLVQRKLAQSTKNIATQAARTGVRPNGQSQNSISSLSENDLIQKVRESDADSPEGQKYLAEMRRRANAALGIQ